MAVLYGRVRSCGTPFVRRRPRVEEIHPRPSAITWNATWIRMVMVKGFKDLISFLPFRQVWRQFWLRMLNI